MVTRVFWTPVGLRRPAWSPRGHLRRIDLIWSFTCLTRTRAVAAIGILNVFFFVDDDEEDFFSLYMEIPPTVPHGLLQAT